MECDLHRGRSPDPWWHSHQYWQPLKESLNGQSKSWSLQWHTYCRQHFLSLCFNHATCKEKICSAVKPAFTLEAASQVLHSEWETLLWTPKHAAWQSQPSSSWRFGVRSDWAQHLPTLPKAPYRNTKLFNFMQWNLFTRWDTDSAWRLVMWQ